MKLKNLARRWSRAGGLTLMLSLAGVASAETITFQFGSVFSGTAPAGAAPWLTATFTDTAGGIRLEITAAGLTGEESVGALYFNLDPLFNPATLSFLRDGSSTGPSAANTSISLAADGFRADGDGFYDILLDLPPPPGTQAARFTAGETLLYYITGPAGLTASSFSWLSTPGPGNGPGPQYAAAHIQQIAGDGSGWAGALPAVPVPPALALFASGIGMLATALRRRRLIS